MLFNGVEMKKKYFEKEIVARTLSILLLMALLNLSVSLASGFETVPGWILHQKSGIAGETTVQLTATSIKVVDKGSSTVIVSSAPKWDVLVYNTSSKAKYASPLSKFGGYRQLGFAMFTGLYIAGIPLEKKPGYSAVNNMKATVYGAPEKFSKYSRQVFDSTKIVYKREEHKIFNPAINKDKGSIRDVAVLASSGWNLPEEEGTILSRLCGIADIPDIPLQAHSIDQEGDKKEALKTLSIRKASLPISDFVVPAGYHSVSTMEAVRLDNRGQDGMEGLLEGIDQHLAK